MTPIILCLWLLMFLSTSSLVFGKPLKEQAPAEPHQEGSTSKKVIKNDRGAIALDKKTCTYGTGILFCSNPDEEDEEILQYLADLEQFFLDWFGD